MATDPKDLGCAKDAQWSPFANNRGRGCSAHRNHNDNCSKGNHQYKDCSVAETHTLNCQDIQHFGTSEDTSEYSPSKQSRDASSMHADILKGHCARRDNTVIGGSKAMPPRN
eukprot:1161302-Pelagomonas_calceolata.AAC.2